MTDREVIEQFYRQISWKDKCEEIEYGDRTLLKTDLVNGSKARIRTCLCC